MKISYIYIYIYICIHTRRERNFYANHSVGSIFAVRIVLIGIDRGSGTIARASRLENAAVEWLTASAACTRYPGTCERVHTKLISCACTRAKHQRRSITGPGTMAKYTETTPILPIN